MLRKLLLVPVLLSLTIICGFNSFAQNNIEQDKETYKNFIKNHPYHNRPYISEQEIKAMPKKDRPDLAIEQNVLMTLDPALGYVPSERASVAYQITKQKLASKAAIPGVTWQERGPNNVGGRTRALMFDPNDGTNKKVWAGGVAGGMWYNNDVTDPNSTWVGVNDFWVNIVVSCIAYDPTNTQVFYVGTGEYFASDGVRGDGMWKTTDGGATWNQIANTVPGAPSSLTDWPYVQDVVVNSAGHVFAATKGDYIDRGGIMKSIDGGNTWTKVLSPRYSGTYAGNFYDRASDLEIAANGDIYCTFGIYSSEGRIFRSIDNGANWTDISPNTTGNRIELAIAPSASSATASTVIYAVADGGSGDNDVQWFKKSINGGATWSDLPIPRLVDDGTTHFTRGQCGYDLIMMVNPTNPDIVIAGGIDLHKTADGGSTWTQISHWYGGFGKPEVHADHHTMMYRPGSSAEMIFGSDGGVHYSTDAGSSMTPSFGMRNKNYNVTQFYACASKNEVASSYFLAGSQDNGSQQFTMPGVGSTSEASGGDGAFCHIDQDNPLIQLTAYTYNDIYRSLDGGVTFNKDVTDQSRGQFINPSDYDNTAKILYSCGGDDELIRYANIDATISTTYISVASLNGVKISNVRANTNTANRIFVGSEGGRVLRIDNANASPTVTRIDDGATPITTTGYVSSIDIGATDNEIIVTYSNYGVISVWYTTDGGNNWTSKDEAGYGLPDMPIRWVLFNPNNTQQVLLATEIGCWSTNNITLANPDWQPSTADLANVRCDMLQHRTSDNLVTIATHGRGLFTTDVFSPVTAEFGVDRELVYIGESIQFTDGSLQASSWSWNFGDAGTSTQQNPTHTYAAGGKYTVTLTINGGASVETKTDYIHVLPNKTPPYLAADGGDFETNANDFGTQIIEGSLNLWERGTPTNAVTTLNSGTNGWKTDLDADVAKGTYRCVLQTPNYDLSSAGTYTLRFRKSMENWFNNAPFGVQLHYSTDKGNSWTRLGTDGDANGTNWYNKGPSSTNQINGTIFADSIGWLGTFTNQLSSYNISFLAGNSDVTFRFVMSVRDGYSQVGYDVDGFMIDDFEVDAVNCSTVSLPLAEDFENTMFPPSCWTSFRGTNDLGTSRDWYRNDTIAQNGSACATVRYESAGGVTQDWLVTPLLAMENQSNSLSFYERQSYAPVYNSNYAVKVSTTSQTDHATFTDVVAYDENGLTTTWAERVVDLSAYNGQNIYVAFVMEQNDGDNWMIDNINITGVAGADVTAPLVTGAVVEDAAPTNLIVSFDENVTITDQTGFTLNGSSGSITGVSGSGTSTLTFTLSTAVVFGETLTLDYNAATGNCVDMAGTPNALATFNGQAVTNNVAAGCGTAMNLPFNEGFENVTFPPDCWTSYRGINGLGVVKDWEKIDTLPHGGTGSAMVRYENVTGGNAQDWLVTPLIHLATSSDSLSFWERQRYTAVYSSAYSVKISTTSQTDHATFTDLVAYDENGLTTSYTERIIDLTAYAGQDVYIAFVMEQDDGDNWYIDDISVYGTDGGQVLVTNIAVSGQGGASTITTNGGTLQMLADVLPANATDPSVTWSVINGTGAATIDAAGLLTAQVDGTVTARATANDGSAVFGEMVVTLSNQLHVMFDWPLKLKDGETEYSYYYISQNVDHDPTAGVLDYNGGNLTYDGHKGIDFVPYPWPRNKQDGDIVEVVAAAAGEIIYKIDGEPDTNCVWGAGATANEIQIRHFDGSVASYVHMKKNSLTTKNVGETVAVGEYLGVVGSSGNSTVAHLHFQVNTITDSLIDPFTGPNNTLNSDTWWNNQPAYHETKLNKLITGTDTSQAFADNCPDPELTYESNTFTQGDRIYFTRFYTYIETNMPSVCTIYEPDNDVFSTWTDSVSSFYRYATSWNSRLLQGNAPVGTWRFEVVFNSVTYETTFTVNAATCNPETVPFTQGFENEIFPPLCWESFRGANGLGIVRDWNRQDTIGHTGNACATVKFENVTGGLAQDWLVTPQISLANGSDSLSFWERQGYTNVYTTNYAIKISTTSQTDPAAFTDLVAYDENGLTTVFTERIVDLTAYAGQNVYIAFVMEQDDGDNWYIDDINVYGTANNDFTAPLVTTAVVENASPSSLVVNFDENVAITNANGFTLNGSSGSITGVTGSGTSTLTFTLSSAVVFGETLTLDYDAGTGNVSDMASVPNALATFNGQAVTNNVQDVAAPLVTSAVVENAAPTDLVVNFNENVTITDASGFTFNGSSGSITGVSGTGTSTLTFTLSSAVVFGETISLTYNAATGNVFDMAASPNALANFTGFIVTNNVLDQTPPVVNSARVDNPAPSDLIVRFSENITITDASGFTLNGTSGTLTGVSGSGTNELTFTISANVLFGEVLTLDYNDAVGNATDMAAPANDLASFAGQSVANNVLFVDVTPPTVTSARVENAAPTDLVVRFNENVTATDASGFTINGTGGSITGVTGSGTNELTFSLSALVVFGEVLTLDYNDGIGNVFDMSTSPNALVTFNGQAVVNNVQFIDAAAPVVTSAVVENAAPNNLIVNFDENVTITDETGFTFNGSSGSITGVSGSGTSTLTFTLSSSVMFGEILTLDYNDATGNVADQASTPNALVSFTGLSVGNNVLYVDATPPTVTSATVENATPDNLVVGFSEPVTITDEAGFVLNGSSGFINGVSGNGTAVLTFTLSSPVMFGEVLSLNYSSAGGNTFDMATVPNALATFTGQSVVNNVIYVDVTPPTITNAFVTNANPSDLVVYFTENVTITDQTGFTLNGSTGSITGVSGSGTSTLTFSLSSAVVFGEILTLDYNDATGNTFDMATAPNALVSFTGQPVSNSVIFVDITPPTITSAVVQNASPSELIVGFSEPVDIASIAGYTLNGSSGSITGVSGTGTNTLTFTLSSGVMFGEALTLDYNDATGNTADQAVSPNPLASITGMNVINNVAFVDVTNPTVTVAVVENAAPSDIVVTYSEIVTISDVTGYTFNGSSGSITGVSGSGTNTLTFTLSSAVLFGETLTLDYNDATGNTADNATAPNPLLSFSGTSVINNVQYVDATPPTATSAVVQDASPSKLMVSFNEPVSATDASGFTLSGSTGSITGVSGSGTTLLTFTLSNPVVFSEVLTLDYVSASGNTSDIATVPNPLGDIVSMSVTNNVGFVDAVAPTATAASVEDAAPSELIVVFDEAVTVIDATGFTLNGSTGSITGVTGSTTNTLTFTLSANVIFGETLTLDYNDATGNVFDEATTPNALVSFAGMSVTNNVAYIYIDNVPPAVAFATVEDAAPSDVMVMFEEDVSITDATGFTINGTAGTISGVSGTGSPLLTFTLTTPVVFGEVLTLDYNDATGNVFDLATTPNALVSFTGQAVANNVLFADTQAPTITGAVVEDAAPADVVVTFSEPVTATDASGYTLNGSAASIIGVTGSGTNTLTFGLSTGVVFGEVLTLDYVSATGNTEDLATVPNPLADVNGQAVINNVVYTDITPPLVLSATVQNGAASDLIVNFSENVTLTNEAGFTLNGTTGFITGVTGSGTSTLTFALSSPVVFGEMLTLDYDDSGGDVFDMAGSPNALITFNGEYVANNVLFADNIPPSIYSANVENATPTQLIVGFSETVSVVDESGFTLNGSTGAITGVSGTGTNTLTFTISSAVIFGEILTMDYNDGLGNVADEATVPNPLAGFTGLTVVNNVQFIDVVAPTALDAFVSNAMPAELVLVLDEPVTIVDATGFTVNGTSGTFTGVTGSTTDILTFTLSADVAFGEVLTLDYDDVAGNVFDEAITPNPLASFSGMPVVNNVASGTVYGIPYYESFDAGIPADYLILDGFGDSYTWVGINDYYSDQLDGTPFIMVDSDGAGSGVNLNEEVTTPMIDATTVTSLVLEFDHYFREYGGSTTEYGEVDVWDGTTWQNVYSISSTSVGYWGAPDHQEIDITAHINAGLMVRFHYFDANYDYYWAVDNISIHEAPPASNVTTLTTTNPTIVTNIDNVGFSINVADGTTVDGLKAVTLVDDGAGTFEVLITSGGAAANGVDIVTNTMVGEATAEDGVTVQEYTISVNPPVTAYPIPFFEDFNGGYPANWVVMDSLGDSQTWYVETDYQGSSLEGTSFAFVNSDAAGSIDMDETLITPVIDASPAASLILEFDHYFREYSGGNAEIGDVDVWDGSAWQNVYSISSASIGDWGAPDHQVIDISAHINADFQLRFHYYDANYEYYWAVDNISVHESSGPSNVTDLSTTNAAIVTAIDNIGFSVNVADATTVDEFKAVTLVDNGAGTLEVLVSSGGAPANGVDVITGVMVAEATAEDGITVQEYTITVDPPAGVYTIPFFEDFDIEIPGDWNVVDGGISTDTWYYEIDYTGSTLDGTPFAFVNSDAAGVGNDMDEELITPVIDASSAVNLVLSFDHYFHTYNGVDDIGEVDVWDGSAWQNVYSNVATDVGDWGTPDHQDIDISAYANANMQVRFHYVANYEWYWAVDNISIVEPQVDVTAITVTGEGGATAITVPAGTLQMYADVLPVNATDASVTWSVISGTGSATIDVAGLLAAVSDGDVTVRATANDASGVFGELVVTISNQSTAYTLPFFEDFDVDIPVDWMIVDGFTDANTWYNETDYTGSTLDGTPFAFVNSDAAGSVDMDEELITPVIDATSATTLLLSFDHFYSSYNEIDDIGEVDVWDGSAWQNVYSNVGTDVGFWGSPDQQTLDITAYKNANLQVRFHYYNVNYEWYWAVDNVSLVNYVSVDEISDAGMNIMVYPNPTRELLNISLSNSDTSVKLELFNIQGQLVFSEFVEYADGYNTSIDVSQLASGTYYLKANSDTENKVVKVIVQ